MAVARLLYIAAAIMLGATPAKAALLYHFDHWYQSVVAYDQGGFWQDVEIDLDVYSGDGDAPAGKYLWKYTINNISYDPGSAPYANVNIYPHPASTNGISGFLLAMSSPVPELSGTNAPWGTWTQAASPGSLKWDIPWTTGHGLMPWANWEGRPSTGVFSFITDAREIALSDEGYFHTWRNFTQDPENPGPDYASDFVGTLGMHVPGALILASPVPEPGSLAILGMGFFALRWVRRYARTSMPA